MARPTCRPVEVLDFIIHESMMLNRYARKPGEIIKHLPQYMRDELKQLTSDDALTMRPENWWNVEKQT
jgi:hypothetical protein